MTKWNLQSEKPIQEHFTRPCWVQRKDGKIKYLFPRDQWKTCDDNLACYIDLDPRLSLYTLRNIVAWQYAELPPKPEPYVAQKPPKDLVGKWMDGATDSPGPWAWHYLIQVKGEKSQRYAQYFPMDRVFNDVLKHLKFKENEVWWLKLEEDEKEEN